MFDRRLLPGDDPDKAIQQMKDEIGAIEPFEIVVEPRDFMYPSEVAKDADVVGALENGIRTMLGYEPKFCFSTAANDTGLFNFRGIQAINYGSRDIRFQHTDHDLVALNNVFNAAKVFAFLGDPPLRSGVQNVQTVQVVQIVRDPNDFEPLERLELRLSAAA